MLRRACASQDRKSTRLDSSHTEIYPLSLHDALPIYNNPLAPLIRAFSFFRIRFVDSTTVDKNAATRMRFTRSEEHTSGLQSHRDLPSFPTRRSSDLQQSSRPAHPGVLLFSHPLRRFYDRG